MKGNDWLVLAELQAYRAARNATKQFQSIAKTINATVAVGLNSAPMPAPIADFMKAVQGPWGSQVKHA